MNSRETEQRIIVDEDWKTQVERERANAQTGEPQTSAEKTSENGDAAQKADESEGVQSLPPASFTLLLSALVTQTLAALGQFPDPVSQQHEIHLDYARHNIDLLAILRDKTRGNLTPQESEMLEDSLHQLRLLYVQVQQGE